MPGVTVKDVNQQELIRALAAFLKKSRKLKVPNEWTQSSWWNIKSLPPVMRSRSTRELLPLHGTCVFLVVLGLPHEQDLWRMTEKRFQAQYFSRGSMSVAYQVLRALEGLKMMEKDEDGGHKLTPQGQRDLDRTWGQVAAANKKH